MARKDILALDIGGPILKAKGGSTPAAYAAAEPTPGGFDGASQLCHEVFDGRMFLLSQCTQEVERVKRDWFVRHKFHELTSIQTDRLVFVREPEEKALVCIRRGVTHFVDDRPHILRHAIGHVPHLFLFNPDPAEVELKENSDVLRHVRIVRNWAELLGILVPF